MSKYLLSYLLAWSAVANVEFIDGKPFIAVAGDNIPLEMTEVSLENQERMFSKKISEEVSAYRSQLKSNKVDLKRHMSAVQNQGQRGSCSAFQVIGLIEHYKNKSANYSEQCLVFFNEQKDSVNPYFRMKYAFENGFYEENDCPYVDPRRYPEWSREELREALKIKARDTIPDLTRTSTTGISGNIEYSETSQHNATENISYIREKVTKGIPVGVIVAVVGAYWEKEGTIISVPSKAEIEASCPKLSSTSSPGKKCTTHAIIITGFDDERGVFYFKNSWSKNWGVNADYLPARSDRYRTGYGIMSYNYFAKFVLDKMITLE